MKTLRIDIKKPGYAQVFLICLGMAAIIFLPFMVFDKGFFLFYGDFNVQQVPFYQHAHEMVRSGSFFWDWNTDLGTNFISSYSFYLLGSPFFWLTLPFPNWFVPYLIGPLLILKLACAGTTGYAFFKRFLNKPEFAVAGGILYAFSGFSLFNLFFNHFHEPIIFFPLLLIALEEAVVNNKKGWFALAVFANLTVNYFFFIGEAIFCVFYFLFRCFSREWKMTVVKFLRLALEALLGFGLGMFLFLPSALVVMLNPRTENTIYGWNALIYWDKYRPMHILTGILFPPDLPARPNFTPDSKAQWSSISAWIPLFSVSGVIAFLQSGKRGHWLKNTMLFLFLCAFVPILNQMFYLFNDSYYARWFYILTLMIILSTMMALENKNTEWGRAVKWTAGIFLGVAVPIAFLTQKPLDNVEEQVIGLMKYPDRFWIYIALSLFSLFFLSVIIKYRKNRRFQSAFFSGIILISIIFSWYFIAMGKMLSFDTRNFVIPHAINGRKNIDLPGMDDENYRIDVYKSMDNMGMFWKMPSINAFHSIVPNSVMEFYPTIGVERGVGTRPDTDVFALRGLTSVRWLFNQVGDTDVFSELDGTDMKMPGYKYAGEQNGFNIWENEYYIPMGFTYDKYITAEEYENVSKGLRSELLLKAIVLDEEQEKIYGDTLEKLDLDDISYSYDSQGFLDEDGNEVDGYAGYKQDCLDRADNSCTGFNTSSRGFTADIELEKENLVFFSVPWEEGWTAYVNGSPVQVEKVNVGFMAVRCPKGASQIEFKYMTPGLIDGLKFSGFTLIVFTAYIGIFSLPGFMRKRRRNKGEITE